MTPPITCPNCGYYLRRQVWYEDGYLVEYVAHCPMCDFAEHWSYGTYFDDNEDDYDKDEYEEDEDGDDQE